MKIYEVKKIIFKTGEYKPAVDERVLISPSLKLAKKFAEFMAEGERCTPMLNDWAATFPTEGGFGAILIKEKHIFTRRIKGVS